MPVLSPSLAWVALLVAGLLEIGWVIGLKYAEGFTRFWPSVIVILCMALSMGLVGISVRTLPLGTAYAVWTGIGTAGAAMGGVLLFGEAATVARMVSIALIVAGVAGLKLLSGPH